MFKSLQDKATKLAKEQLSGKDKEKKSSAPADAPPPQQYQQYDNNNPAGEGSATAPPPQKEQKPDYLDKGFGAAAKKFGLKTDAKTNEKVTDGARGFFEKATGFVTSLSALQTTAGKNKTHANVPRRKKVPEKFSN
ncbi:MAG: hypothetical protein M1813_009826 [Trichoglossum hirsutum]|nr:MAG: hypothetical protein M1813_009826 [Trichoglossum hirsutum]